MNSSIVNHMEKMTRYRLTDKTVKVENVGKAINDVTGIVAFENDKGIYIEDAEYNESVFIPWTSIALLKIIND
jgi:hypothetical protein